IVEPIDDDINLTGNGCGGRIRGGERHELFAVRVDVEPLRTVERADGGRPMNPWMAVLILLAKRQRGLGLQDAHGDECCGDDQVTYRGEMTCAFGFVSFRSPY